MRLSLIILITLLLLSFGCIGERTFTSDKNEIISDSQGFDIDNDGIRDYEIYEFVPVSIEEADIIVQRQIMISTKTNARYVSLAPNITDLDLYSADQNLERFSEETLQAEGECSRNIGLLSVVCSDINSCSKLCSSASVKCRKIADKHQEELAGAMMSYVQSNSELKRLIVDSRRTVFGLKEEERTDAFLQKTRDILYQIARINANPLYSNNELLLCSNSDYGAEHMVEAAKKIGNYETETSGYHYKIMFSITPMEKNGQLGTETRAIELSDRLPSTIIEHEEDIGAIQDIVAEQEASEMVVSWASSEGSMNTRLFSYDFSSTVSPETLTGSLKVPQVKAKTIDMTGFTVTNSLFTLSYGSTGNYYLAFGIAIGITIALLILLYDVIVITFTIISQLVGGSSRTKAFRKAFGRTEVRWRSDIVVAFVFLAAGIYTAVFVATQPTEPPALLDSLEHLIENGMGALAVGLLTIGTVVAYFAAENIVRIIILERTYGMVIKGERDAFLDKIETLKEKIEELKTLVDEHIEQDFDVGEEYDALATLRMDKIDKMAENMNSRTRAIIDDQLTKVENAITSLKERKKLADENWTKWKVTIEKLLNEQDEVYVSSLVTIPASLRTWALRKYAKEEAASGVIFERDSIRKETTTPGRVAVDMVAKGLVNGIVIMKNDHMVSSEFSGMGSTVPSALTLKLKTYLGTLAKNLGQHQPQSFVSIGKKEVIVMMKTQDLDVFLFMERKRFKRAIEHWKAKMRMFGE